MQAVILAAGQGKRLKPLTAERPKCTFPVGDKAVIEHLYEKLDGWRTAVVVAPEDEETKKYLGRDVTYYRQSEPLGTAHSLLAARNFVDEDYFLCLYGDIYTDLKFTPLKQTTIFAKHIKSTQAYGKISQKNGKLESIEEKAGGEGLANAGIYWFPTEIFDHCEQVSKSIRGEYELTDVVQLYMQNKDVYVKQLDSYWNDIGWPWNLLDANQYWLAQLPKPKYGASKVDKRASIKKSVIGDGCKLKNCHLEWSVVGNGCTVGEFSILKRSILMDNSNIPHLNYVADSIIGRKCNLGAGTVTANLRFDEKAISFRRKGKEVSSGKRKLGAIIGDRVKTGINASLMPGVKVGPDAIVGPGVVLKKDLEAGQVKK